MIYVIYEKANRIQCESTNDFRHIPQIINYADRIIKIFDARNSKHGMNAKKFKSDYYLIGPKNRLIVEMEYSGDFNRPLAREVTIEMSWEFEQDQSVLVERKKPSRVFLLDDEGYTLTEFIKKEFNSLLTAMTEYRNETITKVNELNDTVTKLKKDLILVCSKNKMSDSEDFSSLEIEYHYNRLKSTFNLIGDNEKQLITEMNLLDFLTEYIMKLEEFEKDNSIYFGITHDEKLLYSLN